MLKKFAVTNYRGFKERMEWDLSRPSSYEFNIFAVRDGVIKDGIIYGPNGSGKSSFSLALFDIENHIGNKMRKHDYYENFVYAGRPDEPVKFEYTFQFNAGVVKYIYAKNAKGQLVSEQLYVGNEKIFSLSPAEFFLSEAFPLSDGSAEEIKQNANHLSLVNFIVTSFPLAKDHYLMELQKFVNSMLWFRSLRSNEYIGLENRITELEPYIIENNLTDDFSSFLAGVSDQEFHFLAPSKDDKVLMCDIEGAATPFRSIISTGTQSLLLLYYWLTQLDKASFVFIDEFDAYYHFRLSFEVCKQLFAKSCQVFLTSHNTYLMSNDLLRPDCNFILNHNRIKPLVDCTEKELRFAHNIEKLYRGGAFRS